LELRPPNGPCPSHGDVLFRWLLMLRLPEEVARWWGWQNLRFIHLTIPLKLRLIFGDVIALVLMTLVWTELLEYWKGRRKVRRRVTSSTSREVCLLTTGSSLRGVSVFPGVLVDCWEFFTWCQCISWCACWLQGVLYVVSVYFLVCFLIAGSSLHGVSVFPGVLLNCREFFTWCQCISWCASWLQGVLYVVSVYFLVCFLIAGSSLRGVSVFPKVKNVLLLISCPLCCVCMNISDIRWQLWCSHLFSSHSVMISFVC
jgi:uncharacterized membrane protein YtjA (UPF0391 family)